MRKRTRYLFIAIGFVVFFILAPLVILYINGFSFSFGEASYEPTGIFVAKTDPKGAQVFLNGEMAGRTPATLRFLKPGEYSIRIHSDGYFDWTKRLEIKPSIVTWANQNVEKILLIKQQPASLTMGVDVLDFALAGEQIIYLTAENLVVASSAAPGQSQNFLLPQTFTQLVEFENPGIYLLRNSKASLIFSLTDKKFTDASALLDPGSHVAMSPGGTLLSLEQGELFEIDFNRSRKTLLAGNISAFALLGGDLYYLKLEKKQNTLLVTPLAELRRNPGTALLSGIPAAQTSDIIVTPHKEIALVLDDALYRVNSALEPIAANVVDYYFDAADDVLAITTPGELAYYSFADNATRLITRASANMTNARVHAAAGYAFFIMQNQLHALELDNRDGQNDYVIAGNLISPSFTINNSSDIIYLISNGILTAIKTR